MCEIEKNDIKNNYQVICKSEWRRRGEVTTRISGRGPCCARDGFQFFYFRLLLFPCYLNQTMLIKYFSYLSEGWTTDTRRNSRLVRLVMLTFISLHEQSHVAKLLHETVTISYDGSTYVIVTTVKLNERKVKKTCVIPDFLEADNCSHTLPSSLFFSLPV